MKSRASRARRGVLLLVILGLLAIFALVAVTFVVLAGHARRGAETARRIDQQADPPRQVLHQVALQALRGSNNPASVIGPHGLLEDIYGGAHFEYAIPADMDSSLANGQLIQFTIPDASRHIGSVLTMINGAAIGQSTRIVGQNPRDGDGRAQILAFQDGVPAPGDRYVINGTPFSGTGFGFNPMGTTGLLDALTIGEDLNGDGVLDPGEDVNGNGQLDASRPYALLPNPVGFAPNPAFNYFDPAGPGGANEDYDAVDYQNMLLGAQIPNPSNPGQVLATIPSLHRPALIGYWFELMRQQDPANIVDWSDLAPDLLRRIMLRPIKADHPNFDGSNPSFNAAWPGTFIDQDDDDVCDYRWDVDNDGDGVADSIWVDAGLPVRSTPDGRLYKPLAAILCLDMDGRLNLNAHGCWAQTLPDYYGQAAVLDPLRFPDPTNLVDGSTLTASLARGQGYGPAEINLRPLFESPSVSNPLTLFQSLLVGSAGLDGRFGESNASGIPAAGLSNSGDLLSFNKHFDFPNDYYTFAGSYGSPADLKGSMAIGLDLRGQPLYPTLADAASNLGVDNTQPLLNATINDPYELDLSRSGSGNMASPAPVDNPFSPAELERLLRPFDRDTSRLPGRLAALTSPDPANEPSVLTDRRHELTTESWDLPVPNLSGLRLASGLQVSHIEQLLFQRLDEVNGGTPAEIRAMMKYLLPAEVLAGLRMDLNRPFGNGRDDITVDTDGDGVPDSGNGVVDEPGRVFPNDSEGPSFYDLDPIYPGEIAVGGSGNHEKVPQVDANGNAFPVAPNDPNGIEFHHANGINVDGKKRHDQPGDEDKMDLVNGADRALARQLYARHLYVLMMLLADLDYLDAQLGGREATARFLAQWAVNVVDFRDRDSIMTPFEFDIYPFKDDPSDGNPWDVDSEPSSGINLPQRGLVWGCERPELLITETLAFHDRRTEDTADAQYDGDEDEPDPLKPPDNIDTTVGDGDHPDKSFDQRWKPQGSLFVELYNPWSENDPPPGEFCYDRDTDTWYSGVRLQQTTPPDPKDDDKTWPVWRLAIVNQADAEKDPDDPVNPPTTERAVYFVDSSVALPPDGNVQFQPNDTYAAKVAPIMPGRYTVIGPGEPNDSGTSTTYVGFEDSKNPGDPGSSRRIELDPDTNPGTQQVAVLSNPPDDDLNTGAILLGATIRPAAAVVINEPQRLSISEPEDGYLNTDYNPVAGYATPHDQPLDATEPLSQEIQNSGMHENVKVVHLQRLANPLLPYDATTNPYRTIDTMPIDLTSFNGVTNDSDPLDTGTEEDMLARERGDNDTEGLNNLWRQEGLSGTASPKKNEIGTPPIGPPSTTTTDYFGLPIHHTLGYLNYEFFKFNDHDNDPSTPPQPRDAPVGYVGDPPIPPLPPPDNGRNGPFPWLTWNNRPLVSAMELLQVPYTRSSKLLAYYGAPNSDPYTTLEGTYSHLLNFFQSGPSSAPEFHRLLGFVHVPSRFVGTEIQANPQMMAAAFDVAPGGTWIATHSFYPPFNKISRYRDPGRINLNTIFSQDVFEGLMNGFAGTNLGPFWGTFKQSRRGATNDSNMWAIAATSPTRFENPFRSFAGGSMVPPLANGGIALGPPQREVNATLLRADPVDPDRPLFQWQSPNPYENTARNPYFRYQGLQRLGNLVTTRSNVYAVWITIGYFEVEPWAGGVDPAHRDGFALGQELGIDTGEIKRHRAFYLFDRTIPVGFQRGKDLNVEDAIRLKRFIE